MQFYAGFLICCTIVAIVDSMPPMMKSDTEGLPYPSRDSNSIRLFSEHNNDVLPNYSILTFNNFSDNEKMGDSNAILEGIWCQNVNSDDSSGQWYAPYNVTVPEYRGDFGMEIPGPGDHGGKVKHPENNEYDGKSPIYSADFEGQTVLLRDRDSEFQSDEGLYYCTISNTVLVVGLYAETTYNKNDGPVATDSIAYFEKGGDTVIMTFNVSSGPPTSITCTGPSDFEVNESSMDVQRIVLNEEITAVRIVLRERHEGIIQCNVSNERVTQGTINGTNASIGITSLRIGKESPVTTISVKRLATGIAEYEISWSGSSPYYEISYYNLELNITNIIGHTNHSSFIAKFNISSTTLVDNLMINVRVVGHGIPNDASMLPSDPSTSEQIQLGYPLITDLTLSAPSTTAVYVNWNQTSIDPLNGYNVKTTCKDFCGNSTQQNYNAEQNSFSLTGLSPGTMCNISVSAMYGEVEILSDVQVQRTLFSIPTLPPENLQVLSVTSYSIEVTWDDVLCSGQNGPITGYAVVYMYDSSELIVEFNTSITLENLLPYTTYLIRITPINEVGKGYSSALLAQQTEESEPAQVSNIVSSAKNASSVILSWDEPSIRRGIITKYDIRYGESNSTEYVFGVNEQYYEINGLQPATEYSIAVRAHTVVGPGEWSEITVILLPEIQDILLIPVKDAINITWSSPNLANGNLLKTIVQFSNSLDDHIYEIMLSSDTNSLILPLQLNSQFYNFTIFGIYVVDMKVCEGLHRSIMYIVDSTMQENNCSSSDGGDIQSEGINPQKSDSTSVFLVTAVSALSALALLMFIIIVILIYNIRKIKSKLAFTPSDPPIQLSQLRHVSRDETYVDMKSQPHYENLRSSCEKEIDVDEEEKAQEASGVYEAIL